MESIEQTIYKRLEEKFSPLALTVKNESAAHHGHTHNPKNGPETHFHITIVSKDFNGLSRLMQQRKVLGVLKDLMNNPIHALSLSSTGTT